MSAVILSTVTPVFQGARHLEDLVTALQAVRDELDGSGLPLVLGEAIFVDDASRDGSADVLARLEAQHSWIRVVTLSRNFGQHPATAAGILHASGDWIATLDEDFQHHPGYLIGLLRQAVAGGLDVVYAAADGDVHPGWLRNAASRLFKRLAGWATGRPEVRRFNSFRMMRGGIARAAAAVSRHETYFDVALCWFTDRLGSLRVPLRERRHERSESSSYGLRTLLGHGRRLLISSEVRPLRAGGAIGLIALLSGLLGACFIVVQKLLWPESIAVPGWASLMVVLLFFCGLIALLLGIALEYISHLYLHALGRPAFFTVDRSSDRLLEPLLEYRGKDAAVRAPSGR